LPSDGTNYTFVPLRQNCVHGALPLGCKEAA
jgi:hypothetical protein